MSKLKFVISSLMIFSLLVGCTEDEKVDITGISFDGDTITVTEGLSYDASDAVVVTGGDADQANITFTSGDANIVSVDGTTLTAEAVGSTTLTATETNSDLTATVNVNVIAKLVAVTGVSLDKEAEDLKVGETLQLVATIAPADATEQGVTWSVAFPSGSKTKEDEPTDIATVSDAGLVTAIAAGEVVVTAKSKDGDFTASATISITNVAVEIVTIDQETIDVVGNAEVQLTATILPENATNKKITWSLELNEVAARTGAAVDASYYAEIDAETGLLKGKKDCDGCGLTVVVTSEDGAKSGDRTAKVTYVAVTGITLDPTSLDMNAGDTQQMTATITPDNATNQTITWVIEEDDSAPCRVSALEIPDVTDFATVDEDGLVTAIKKVEYYCAIQLTASVDDGISESAALSISDILATSVTIDQGDAAIELERGETITLSATVLPENTTNAEIYWSTSHPEARTAAAAVACDPTTVDSDTGVVTASSDCNGEKTIYAYNADSGEIDSIVINVVCNLCD
ncbi:Ig-like domain-containing protein [Reichenbachiella sp.]|uniref:Ig-like domain-containing protein n=1 Tax=Reichenbachiella sp. TaxID=2184521 RepID=UPI003BB21BF1